MKRISLFIFLVFACSVGFTQTNTSLAVKQIKLKNGLTVWLNQDHSRPIVYGGVVVKAGAKDCPNTGIAHYFEHMMFKGTDKIGTIDYEKEKIYLDSIDSAYDKLGATKDESERKAIQQKINELSVKAADYALPNEFQQLVSKYGGSMLNAATSYDFTVFFNAFTPGYLKQWAELNSERLIYPVFRLFQNELETVYEEKNMYSDSMIQQAIMHSLSSIFGDYPYSYPIIGSTENLKNPSLSAMRDFYNKYYVANNMGLILTGDFDMDNIENILENSFGRIKSGIAPNRVYGEFKPFAENRKEKIKIPFPIIKGEAVVYYGIPQFNKDANALDMAVGIPSNDNKTGYLDSLTNNHKMMFASALRISLNEAGILVLGYIPKIPFGSVDKARSQVMEQVKRLKVGDFSDKLFESLKLQVSIKAKENLEDMENRGMTMLSVLSAGLDWNSYLSQVDDISNITKDDVVRAANKYFTGNYIMLDKKYGRYPKDKLDKPEYTPVLPKNENDKSEYAKAMDKDIVSLAKPKYLDYDKDADCIALTPLVKLYSKSNDINDLFSLKINFRKGTLADNRLDLLSDLLNQACTESTTKQTWNLKLQELGSSISASSDKNQFSLELKGIDKNFDTSLKLLADFMLNAKITKSDLKDAIKEYNIGFNAMKEDKNAIVKAMLNKVRYGGKSPELNILSKKGSKSIKLDDCITLFNQIQGVECNILYCGGKSSEKVAELVKKDLPVNKVTEKANEIVLAQAKDVAPTLYFYNMSSARQSEIATYQPLGTVNDIKDKEVLELWGNYVGSGFSSLLFQEIREYRSYAYFALGQIAMTPLLYPDYTSSYMSVLSTQTDKTMQALQVLDSIFKSMPVKMKNFDVIKQEAINDIKNSYPSMRKIPAVIADKKDKGYIENQDKARIDILDSLNIDDINTFYKDRVQKGNRVIVIVGNKKNLPMKELEKYGKVVELKFSDIVRY